MSALLFIVARLAVIAFGLPVAFAPGLRSLHWPARIAAAYGAGAVVLTVWSVLLSLIGVRWSLVTLGVLVLLAVRRYRRGERPAIKLHKAWILTILGWLHLVLAIGTMRITSADYLYFWGTKGERFALAGGFDVALLKQEFMIHLHPNYPPLVPVNYAWDVLVVGEMAWRTEMYHTALWTIAASLLLHGILSLGIDSTRAAHVVGFWTAALALGLHVSFTGGNAEQPLVFFATIAAAALFSRERGLLPLAAIMLAGCVLTKVEGNVLATLIVLAAIPLVHWRRLLFVALVPGVAFGIWQVFLIANNIPLTDPTREKIGRLSFDHVPQIIASLFDNLHLGAFWVPWLVPLVILALHWREWRASLPFVFVAFAMMGFYFVFYLHVEGNLAQKIAFGMPRLALPSLAILIAGAGTVRGALSEQ